MPVRGRDYKQSLTNFVDLDPKLLAPAGSHTVKEDSEDSGSVEEDPKSDLLCF